VSTIGDMNIEVSCPSCGEDDRLTGSRSGRLIRLSCDVCGRSWDRDPSPRCGICDGDDLQAVVQAIVEKSRGNQLSVVGTQIVHMCRTCDAVVLERYNRNRPSPLMPDQLPTVNPGEGRPD